MPYYGDVGSPYYGYGSTGPYANHSSLIGSGIGRYHNPIAARYSPHLSTISETPFVTLRRYGPTVPTSATTSLSRPRRVIDTADIDVTKPPSSRSLDHRHQQQQRHRLRRDRPTIKIRSQALKDNPALREYNEKHEKTVGEMLVEKFLIKDKNARDAEPPKIKLYHQASLMRDGELSKERENEILAAIRHRITRKMTRRRSSVDTIPLDPEQIEREAALHAAQAEALDTLVAEELAEAEMEVRKGTFTKRHSLVMLPVEISEASESEDEADEEERKSNELLRKHATAKKKRRRKSIDKYSQSDEEEDTFSISESIIEEEEFEWDDRDKCDDLKKIMPKDEATIKVPEQKRAVSPRMEKKEKLDEVGNRLKELRKEVRKMEKKERDIKHDKCELKENKKEKIAPKKEEMNAEIVKPKTEKIKAVEIEPKVDNLKVGAVEAKVGEVKKEYIIPELEEKTKEILKEELRKDDVLPNKEAIKPKVEELKKATEPKAEEMKKVSEPKAEELKKAVEPKVEELKKEAAPKAKEFNKIVEPKAEELKKAAKPKVEELKKTVEPKAGGLKKEAESKAKELNKIVELKAEELKKATESKAEELKKVIEPKAEELKKAVEPKAEELNKIVEPKAEELKKAAKPKAEELKKTVEPKVGELKKEAESKAKELKKIVEPKAEELKRAAESKAEELKKAVEPKAEELNKIVEPKAEELKKAAKPKAEELKKTVEPKVGELKKEAESKAKELKKIDEPKAEELKRAAESKAEELKKAVEPKAEELKKAVEPKAEELKKEAEPKAKELNKIVEPKAEELKKAAKSKAEELKKVVEPKTEGLKKAAEPKAEELKKAAKPKVEELNKESDKIVPETVSPKIEETKKETPKKDILHKQTDTPKKEVEAVKVDEPKILEQKDDDKNLRSGKSEAASAEPAKDVTLEQKKALETKDKEEKSKLHKDDTTAAAAPKEEEKTPKEESKLKVKERKFKEKPPKLDHNKLKRTTSAPQQLPPEPESPCFKIEACNSVGDMSTLYVKSTSSAEAIRNIEQFRESIRLPAPKSRTTIETEVVLPVRKPYVRDTSRNSVYLALKPMRKEVDAKSSSSVISEEGEIERDDHQPRQIDEKISRPRGAKEELASWWDETPIDVQDKTVDKSEDKVAEEVIEKKVKVKAKDKSVVEKKVEPVVTKKVTPAVSKVTTNKTADKPTELAKVEEKKPEVKVEVKSDSKIKVDDTEVKLNDNIAADKKINDITVKSQVVEDKSATDKKVKVTKAAAAAAAAVKEPSYVESQKKSETLPKVANDKTITPAVDDVVVVVDNNNKTTSRDVTCIANESEETTIIAAAAAKRDEARKKKVDAQAIMKIEKRILEEAESPDKILTTAALLPVEKKEDEEEEKKKKLGLDGKKSTATTTTEIDFWNEIETPLLPQPLDDTAVEPQLQQQTSNNLKLDLTRIDLTAQDDLSTPLIKDQDTTPIVEQPATPFEENLEQVPAINLQLTEEERRSTIKFNGVKEDNEQVDELSGTVKKISKWENHDNLTSLDSNATAVASKEISPEVSTTSSVTKKKIVKKKKSTIAKKTGEAGAKKTGESTKKTSGKVKTPAKKTTTATPPQPAQLKSAMSASGSPRNSPVQRPADLQKLFYTTPAILLTATPRDLRKVRRAKAKKKKPPTRTPSLSSDSTGSTRSTATTSTEEGSNCEEDAEQKRLNSTRSNDSGFDGSPRLSNCDMVCHKKCEKLTGNLCGLNQKLVAEALQALKKAPSQSSENQRNADGDHFHHSGRITPPATNLPRFKKYEVTDFNFLKVLGKGSFGKVLLAELRGTECVYAVKCLKKDVVLEDDDVECTLIERKVLTLATRHPYLCHLFCTFQTESHLFFVMEYLNGGDLMFHIQKSGRFSEPRAKFYAAEIWSGLIFLHKKGIVYRDLKLDNVLLDFEGHIRIADFGMCKLQIFLDRTADTFCGTPDYMAPEIIKGLKYNQAVDWWSFGVLLYEMLTGQSPFSGCDEDELFWSICNERPFIPRYLSQSSTDILVCLLEKDSGKRIPGHEIACHTFFCNISWEKLERRVLEPPFKPAVEHTLDTRYFDTAFTAERPRLTPVPEEILTSMDQAVFRGFSYTNPNATD